MSDISQIKLPDNTTYNINAKTVNGHTVDKDVPSNAVFTDQYVAQVSSLTEDNNYRVLLSGSASDNTQTESVRKSPAIKINPKYDAITMGYDRASGSAYGVCSLTQGSNIIASGQYSHGEGWWTIANHRSQHVFGEYNIADANAASATARGNYVEIVGNGTGYSTRSNARTLDWDGTETLAGSLLLAGTTSDIHLTGTDNYWYGTTTSLKTAVSSLEHDLSDLTPLEKTASGAIASFDDGSDLPMPKLEVAIEPQQDLHGYDSPWVGGAGKNKLGSSSYGGNYGKVVGDDLKTGTPQSYNITTNGTITVESVAAWGGVLFVTPPLEAGSYSVPEQNISVTSGSNPRCGIYITDSNLIVKSVVGYRRYPGNYAKTDVTVESGDRIAYGVSNADANSTTTITNFYVAKTSDLPSGYTPYSNICPISGWDEANVNVVGKNILGGLPLANAIVNAGGTLDTVNKTVSFTHGNSQVNILDKVKLKENTKYTFILTYSNTGDNNCLSLFYKTSGTRYPINLNNSSDTKTTIVYTTSAITIDKLVLGWIVDASTKIYYEESGLFEGELTASDFEAYNGQTYNIQFKDGDNPLTVYGGSLDVVNGELTVYVPDTLRIKLSSMNWVYQDAQGRFYGIAPANIQKPTTNSELPQYFMCECYRANPYANYQNGDITITMAGSVFVKDGNYTDVIAWLNAVGDYYVTFSLATPITIQLTPTQVKSLLGVNNIWADTGDVNVIYFRNAKSTQAIKDVIATTTAKDIAFTKYKGLPTNVQEAINKTYDNVSALNNNMADGYLERQSYSVDDYVRYEDPYYGGYNLYRCIERSDGGSFDYNKWTRVNIGDEFSEIKQSLSDLVQSITLSNQTTNSQGMIITNLDFDGKWISAYVAGGRYASFRPSVSDKLVIRLVNDNGEVVTNTSVNVTLYHIGAIN